MFFGAEVVEEKVEYPVPVVLLAKCDHPGDEEGVWSDLTPGAVPGPCQGCVGDGDGGGYAQVWGIAGTGFVN